MPKTKVFIKYDDGGRMTCIYKNALSAEIGAKAFAEKPGTVRVTMQTYPLRYNDMKVIK